MLTLNFQQVSLMPVLNMDKSDIEAALKKSTRVNIYPCTSIFNIFFTF